MKRPAFQFYPADWRKDVELRSCSLAARGLWIDLLCIAHECEPYGHLTVNGKPMNAGQIAGQVGLTKPQCSALLAELAENGVARTTPEGTIYSKRMVEDERLRSIRAEAGKLGGNPALLGNKVNQKPTTEVNHKPTPSSSSSSSASTKDQEPTVLPAPPLRVVPAAPPAFDGNNGKATPSKALVLLAATFDLPEEWGVDAEALGFPRSKVLFESERFRQYWATGKGQGKRKTLRGWRQAWSNWLGKAAERAA